MTEYRNRSTGQVNTQGEIRKMHPNTSFPKTWAQATLDFIGLDPVLPVDAPEPSSELKKVVRDGVEQNSDGEWVYAWVEENKFSSSEEEQEHLNDLAAGEELAARDLRSIRLAETDYWVLADTPDTTAEQTAYRQALRDITSHANWPRLDEADWPTKP